jgi:hypothetical protein
MALIELSVMVLKIVGVKFKLFSCNENTGNHTP